MTVSTRPQQQTREHGFWGPVARLVRASPALVDPADRQRAELLSALLALLVPLALFSGFVQFLLDPRTYFVLMSVTGAAVLLSVAYGLSRTRHYRAAAMLLCLGPILVSCAVGYAHPRDPVWFGFPIVSVILASVLLSARAALATAALSCATVSLTFWLQHDGPPPADRVAALALNTVLASLIIVSTWYRNQLEALRERLLRAREAELAESRRMESIGRLAGGIAHDFNNLLTVVLANAELLARGRSVATAAREIESAGTRAAELTRQLLSYAKQQVTTPTIVSANEIAFNLEPIVRRLLRENIRLEVQREPSLWSVKIDPTQLEQVILNLAVNARDAMPDGGVLTVRTANVSRVIDGVESELVELSVRDTGVGMTRETLQRVFEPFFTTKSPGIGTGLGLATVQAIVQDARGFVEVDSAPGQGTVFRVYLPRTHERTRVSVVPVLEPVHVPRPRSAIMLVEDDPLVRRSVARMLSDTSLEVIEAEGVRHAQMLFTAHQGRIEVVLTDVVLADGSGVTLAESLREKDSGVAVLLMTGYADELTQSDGRPPDLPVLSKPFSSRELSLALSRALEQAQENDQLENQKLVS